MKYEYWVMLGRTMEDMEDVFELLATFLKDVLHIAHLMWFLGAHHDDVNEVVTQAGSRFLTDIGYEELALEIDDILVMEYE